MFRRLILLFVSLLGLTAPVPAADPQWKEPYELKVMLHVEHHRLLTDIFVDRLQRELGDWLQEVLGELGHVSVLKPDAPLATAMEKGLHTLDPVRDPSQPKTHFVRIRFLKGQYEIQTRQFDGMTGLWSPVRTDRTRAPDVVSKMATSLVYRDFGVVGTVVEPSKMNDQTPVKIELKGGGLGVPMSRWVKEKEVFAIVPMKNDGTPDARLPWALLRVTEAPAPGSGTCTCMLYHRHPLDPTPAQGYRCIKLGTTTGPLKIRVSQAGEDGGSLPLTEALDVGVSATGFEGPKSPILGLARAETGVFESSPKNGIFENVAFVWIKSSPEAIVPVEIIDDGYVDIRVSATKDEGLLLTLQRDAWKRSINQVYQMQINIFEELLQMVTKAENRGKAIDRAKASLDRFRKEVVELRKAGNNLSKVLRAANRPLDLDADFKRLGDIEVQAEALAKFIQELEEAEKQENSPELKRWIQMRNDGEIAEKAGDYETAIKIYETMLSQVPGSVKKDIVDNVKDHGAKLKELWEPKSPAHSNVRNFVMKTFPAMTPAEVKGQIKDVREAVEELKKAEDRFFLPKFYQAINAYGQKMTERLESLKPKESAEDREQAELIRDVAKELNPIQTDIAQAVDALSKKK